MAAGTARRSERFRLSLRPNGLPYARLALVVAKRHAPRAVDRNRVRRLAREAFRIHQQRFAGQDLVVRLTASIAERPVTLAEIEALLLGSRRA
ncbi:MAG: ribonuclease P protein component [Burkholderiales bacterium]|nr:ribonuclease P protein component [Burkholderiales bacterium]